MRLTQIRTERTKNSKYQYKLILLGDCDVGKTTIFNNYFHKTITQSTSTLDFSKKIIPFNQKQIQLTIWDTKGQSQFQTIIASSLKSCQGVMLIFNMSNQQSWNNIKRIWYPLVKSKVSQAVCLLIGNKSDLEVKVNKQEISNWSRQNQIYFVQTCGITGKNIQQSFYTLTAFIFKKNQNQTYDRRYKKYQTMKDLSYYQSQSQTYLEESIVHVRKNTVM